ncbi:MAG: hypothetical protein LQ347_000848 [Umbilicaria vellea]|nr:MAG: hypothetical protein LQ347_000848 [Umbilicaria vellea]
MAFQSPALAAQVSAHLTSTKALSPSPAWLTSFLSTQKPTTPFSAIAQTALFRLLASDITTSLTTNALNSLPADVHNAKTRERHLLGPIPVQVLGIEDMSKSRWEQIEAIEALERGEGTKGREIIRVVPTEDGGDSNDRVTKGGGPHKLLLQDAKGTRVYGMELKAVEGVGLGMNIGCKIVLKNAVVARGVVLLSPPTTTTVGGKIEALHQSWKENRKAQLKASIESTERLV